MDNRVQRELLQVELELVSNSTSLVPRLITAAVEVLAVWVAQPRVLEE